MRTTLDNVNVVRFRVGVVEWFGEAGLLHDLLVMHILVPELPPEQKDGTQSFNDLMSFGNYLFI